MTHGHLALYTDMATHVEEAILDALADFEPLAIWEVCLIVGLATAEVYDAYAKGNETEEESTT